MARKHFLCLSIFAGEDSYKSIYTPSLYVILHTHILHKKKLHRYKVHNTCYSVIPNEEPSLLALSYPFGLVSGLGSIFSKDCRMPRSQRSSLGKNVLLIGKYRSCTGHVSVFLTSSSG